MTPRGARRLLACGIALLPASFVAGVALQIYGVSPTVLLLAMIGAGNVLATAGSLLVFLVGRVPTLHTHDYVVFLGVPIAGAAWAWARHTMGLRATSPTTTSRARRPRPSWPAVLALPFIVAVLYSDISEVLIVKFGLPSLLQASLASAALVIWVYRDELAPARILVHPLTVLLAAYCAAVFVSTVWAADGALADVQVVKAIKNLVVYLVAAMLATSWIALRRSLATMALIGAGLSAVSLFQITTGNTVGELGGLATLAYGNLYEDASDVRAAGPVSDANFYGQILVMVIPLALSLASTATRRRWQVFWVAVATLITGGVLMTYSRGAMLALTVMTAIILASMRVKVMRVALATAAMVALLLAMPGNVGRRFMTFETFLPRHRYYVPTDSSFEKRKLLLATTTRMFADHPILGVGAGNFTTFFPQYSNEAGSPAEHFYRSGELEHPHSVYLELGAETGSIGLILFAAIVGTAFAQLRRGRQRLVDLGHRTHEIRIGLGLAMALCAYLVTSMFLHGYTQRYFWLLLALAAAVSRLTADEVRNAPLDVAVRAESPVASLPESAAA
ncbi:MAG: O-antigen ligase family protein [Thermoanaerobaculia bacterium]